MTDQELGYNDFFEQERIAAFKDLAVARVISEQREAYRVKNGTGEYLAKITGRQRFMAADREDFPAVGDWVAITVLDQDQALINGILPRQSVIKRKIGDKSRKGDKKETQVIAANIDVAFVVESVDRDFNLNRFERYFALAESGGVDAAIVLNKIDLLPAADREEILAKIKERFPQAPIILTSAWDEHGLADLKDYIVQGKTYCFLGSSGVGKSSLINKLLGTNKLKTGEVSAYSGRGKHTTTNRQMYFLGNGGIVIDNPGMREVGVADAGSGVDSIFADITELAENCKFTNCTHLHEPGCAVLAAVERGELAKDKYENYLGLKKETDYYEMSDLEKRESDRQFGKFLKRAKKDFKQLKPGKWE